jgi:hypothetical protein
MKKIMQKLYPIDDNDDAAAATATGTAIQKFIIPFVSIGEHVISDCSSVGDVFIGGQTAERFIQQH